MIDRQYPQPQIPIQLRILSLRPSSLVFYSLCAVLLVQTPNETPHHIKRGGPRVVSSHKDMRALLYSSDINQTAVGLFVTA